MVSSIPGACKGKTGPFPPVRPACYPRGVVREVDFLVIGAGIAGMTFYRYLGSDRVVVVDYHPGRYKIGESIIPQHFFPTGLRPMLEEARKLPSASAKRGTIFVSSDAVSYFHSFYDAAYTIHLDRQELEALYRRAFDVPILEERVTDIDFERKIVRTDRQEFRVRRQIVDCSGPAMVVARRLGIAREVWPVWAGWSYWDVHATRDARFWQRLRDEGTPFYRFDDVTSKIERAEVDDSRKASEVTMLTRFADGVWTWQIPLHHAKLLSFGVVTRHGQVSRERYLEIAREALGVQYDATIRPWDDSSPHNRFHRRDRFAWAATRFASPDWLLVGDAAFFGDPVYSVGTGIATSQAIRAATLIREGSWESSGHEVFHQRTAEIFERAKAAYDHWYAGEVTAVDEVAHDIQVGFLNGLDLHVRTGEGYVDMWDVAAPDDRSCDPANEGRSDGIAIEAIPEALRAGGGWRLSRVSRRRGGLELDWDTDGDEGLTMTIELRDSGQPCFQAAGPFALSYRSSPDEPRAIDDRTRALFAHVARAVMAHQHAVLDLIERRPRS
jgi:flavin-dependent dehydrogenase